MSDISDLSITSRTAPLYSSTLNSKGVTPEKSSRRKMNNLRTNPDSSSEEDAIETRNNQRNLNPKILDSPDPKHETRLKLKVVITKADQSSRVVNVLNDLSKPQSPMAEKNTSDHVTSAKDSPARPNRNMPVMGRSALLKKANVDNTDSLIIYDLITEKYHGVINHYLDRSYRRRKMRSESPSNYSDTVFSSLPAYSPLSLSSVGTPGSELVDDTEGFKFPGVGGNILAKLPQPDLRFIASTDDMNVETTIEDEEVSSTGTSATEKSTTSYSDYDPHKFLDHALGEITDLSAAYEFSQGMDENHRTNLEQLKSDSIGTSNLSLLLSKASSLYMLSASRRNINNNFRTGPLEPGIPESPEKDQLMKELSLQNEIMFQVSKALNYCRTTKKFESSVELVEAEKNIATCTKEVLTKEIQNIEDESYEPEISSKCSGEVTLSNLTFYPKEGRKDEKSHRDFTEYFLAVLTCGSVVLASEILTADGKGVVEVARKFSFANLAIDFEISVCVYAMRVGNKIHQQQEQKKTCSSPKRIFFHLRRSTKKPKDPSDTVYIKPSSFHMWGKCDIRSSDLSRSGDEGVLRLKMHHTPLGSSSPETSPQRSTPA
ncbi:hypothetical protein NQ318_005175 [Aromia moschata]|uniref:Anillin homology domain-containing protein n=1 Tax=Aromia moschata TaxID=1265417 RepID=A0AAV8XIP3_9CUCU|nr:hypothetical protein NQ318_005175 [Aromia moschata]